jgi:hypothetical protein
MKPKQQRRARNKVESTHINGCCCCCESLENFWSGQEEKQTKEIKEPNETTRLFSDDVRGVNTETGKGR